MNVYQERFVLRQMLRNLVSGNQPAMSQYFKSDLESIAPSIDTAMFRSPISNFNQALRRSSARIHLLEKQRVAEYSTKTSGRQDTVQTPLQTQTKANITQDPFQPGAEGSRIQTPVQGQAAQNVSPHQSRKGAKEESIRGPIIFLICGLAATPPIVYFRYKQRKAQMDEKRAKLLREAEERYYANPKN